MEGALIVLILKGVNEVLKFNVSIFLITHQFHQVNETLFPCKLSKTNLELAEDAVNLAVQTWGKRSLTELEAEERLSYSCEKVLI